MPWTPTNIHKELVKISEKISTQYLSDRSLDLQDECAKVASQLDMSGPQSQRLGEFVNTQVHMRLQKIDPQADFPVVDPVALSKISRVKHAQISDSEIVGVHRTRLIEPSSEGLNKTACLAPVVDYSEFELDDDSHAHFTKLSSMASVAVRSEEAIRAVAVDAVYAYGRTKTAHQDIVEALADSIREYMSCIDGLAQFAVINELSPSFVVKQAMERIRDQGSVITSDYLIRQGVDASDIHVPKVSSIALDHAIDASLDRAASALYRVQQLHQLSCDSAERLSEALDLASKAISEM